MPYTALLNKLIDESGLTVKEIAEKCTESGVKVTPAYISTLRNDTNNRCASDTMSRAIARACGSKNEELLVIEAYVDNAPKAMKGVFDFIKESIINITVGVFENSYSDIEIEAIKKQFEDMPLSEIISEIGKNKQVNFSKNIGTMNLSETVKDNDYSFTAQLKQAVGFNIDDNSMFPTMPKGGKATIEMLNINEYSDGDIVAYTEKGSNKLMFRKVAFVDDKHSKLMMFPLNTDYDSKKYNIDDITLLGKVKQVVCDIK